MSQKIYKNRKAISHVLENDLFIKVDDLAKKHGKSTREVINIAIEKIVREGVK